jgi:DNA-binding response OmpR family regulator
MMPNLSGISLITLLEKNFGGKIPVILISALDQSPAILQSLGLSANDCFVKPINYEELIKRVRAYEKKNPA